MTASVPSAEVELTRRLAERSPRVQCLTNTVAQAITANALLALGVRVSMAIHPDEVVAMTQGADAVLINLGTLDPVREAAIDRLVGSGVLSGKPVVLDPVFVEHSPLRMQRAARLAGLGLGRLAVRGNRTEIDALRKVVGTPPHPVTWVTTGPIDVVELGVRRDEARAGHPLMAGVTGLGCAAGAVVAAFMAIEADPVMAALAALTTFGRAGERAGLSCRGPGSFATAFLDELAASAGAGRDKAELRS